MIAAMCLALWIQQDQPEPTKETPPRTERTFLEAFHGRVSLKYRLRTTSDETDSDLFQFVRLSFADPEKDLITAVLSARFAEDLDGERDVSGFFAFDSIDDTYHRGSTGRLYTAYVDLNLPTFRLRGGRQTIDEIPEAVSMDGGSARYEPVEWLTLTAFAGLPVNLFESSSSGDLMYGGTIEAAPWTRGRVGVQYMHLEDENAFGLFDDDLIGIFFEQGLGPVLAGLRYTALERESRDLVARFTASFSEIDMLVDAQIMYLFKRQQALSYPIDSYSIFLIELEPYYQLSLRVSKAFGGHFAVDAAVTARELAEDGDEKDYNHEFVRWSVTPRLDDWPLKNVSLAVSGDFWQTSRDDFLTIGGDVSWRLHPALTLSAGTAYSIFKIDELTGEERERVRSYYATIRWKITKSVILDLRAAYEDNETDGFTTLEFGIRHEF